MKSYFISYYINIAGILIFSFILIGGFYMQFIEHDFPCPLCLMQRMAMLGVLFGALLNVLYKIKPAHYGISILSALLGISLSSRQILLHICPLPDGTVTNYGLPVMGMHLYSWALMFFFISLVAFAILCIIYKEEFKDITTPKSLLKLSRFVFYLVAIITLINFVSTFFECALGVCPDDPVEYMLMKGKYY